MLNVDLTDLSPNVNNASMPASCRTVIIHCTRSGVSMNPSEFVGTLNYMRRSGTTSSHLVIGREANQTARVVPDNRQAWHAGEDNDNAWGIEICQGVEVDGFTEEQLLQVIIAGRHYVELGVPLRHAANSTEGGFIGHQETAQGKSFGKSDPGRFFPWEWFIAALQEEPNMDGDGWQKIGKQMVLVNEGVEVFKVGDEAGEFPGRIAKNFGGRFYYLRMQQLDDIDVPLVADAEWTLEEGD